MKLAANILKEQSFALVPNNDSISGRKQEVVKIVGTVINDLINQLRSIFTGSEHLFRDEALAKELRIQWVMALAENGITTQAQFNAGLAIARTQNNPFFPSPGQFIAWCKSGQNEVYGLPAVDDVMKEFKNYCADRLLYPSAEQFPWSHPVNYWIVTDLRRSMLQYNQPEYEIKKRAEKLLGQWAKKIEQGESVPAPRIQIEQKHHGVPDWHKDVGDAFLARVRASLNKNKG